ncbi:MAG: hypothetical protein ABII79_08065 [bacterium]
MGKNNKTGKSKKKVGRKGKPVKIPVDFDKAMDGFVSINEEDKHEKEK